MHVVFDSCRLNTRRKPTNCVGFKSNVLRLLVCISPRICFLSPESLIALCCHLVFRKSLDIAVHLATTDSLIVTLINMIHRITVHLPFSERLALSLAIEPPSDEKGQKGRVAFGLLGSGLISLGLYGFGLFGFGLFGIEVCGMNKFAFRGDHCTP
jgi:hypothetical protein